MVGVAAVLLTKDAVSSYWVTRNDKRVRVISGDHDQGVLGVCNGICLLHCQVHRHYVMKGLNRLAAVVSQVNFTP